MSTPGARRRILVAAPWVPSARRPRSFGLIQVLAQAHDVTVVAATWDEEDVHDLDRLVDLGVRRAVAVPMSRPRALVRALAAVLGDDSLQRAFLSSPELTRAVEQEVRTFRPDLGYLNVLRTTHLRPSLGDVPCVLDLDEYRSGFYRQMADHSRNPLWRTIARVEARRMGRIERDLDRDYRAVMLSAPGDAPPDHPVRALVRSPHALRLPAGARPEGADAPTVQLSGRSLLFVGRLSYRANTEALVWFVREVMPGVLAQVPDAHLHVVGDSPTREVRRLAGPSVSVVGRVPDVTPYYRAAEVSLVPVTLATGVQMKLIESLASGVPTVATPITAGQAGVVHDRECLVADGVRPWVDQVCLLLQDRATAERLADSGRAWAAEAYDPASIGSALLGVVDRASRTT